MCLGCYLVPCPRVSYTTAQEKHEENNSMGYSMHPSHDGGIESSHEKLSVPCPCLRHPARPPTDPPVKCSTQRRKKMGLPVAYKTIGTFLAQEIRREDASGRVTNSCKTVDTQRHIKDPRQAVCTGPGTQPILSLQL